MIVFVGQWAAFLGLSAGRQPHFHDTLWALLQRVPTTHAGTLLIGVFSLAVLLLAPRLIPHRLNKIPAPLLAIVLATLLQMALQAGGWSSGVATIASAFGGIPQGLPSFALPDFASQPLSLLLLPALSIALHRCRHHGQASACPAP
jgi:sulfate permease, SulP family